MFYRDGLFNCLALFINIIETFVFNFSFIPYELYYDNGFSYVTHNIHCGMAQAKPTTWITLGLKSLKWVLHRKSTSEPVYKYYIHNEDSHGKILPRKSWIAPKVTTKAVSIVFIIIMDVREAEHEK